MFDDRKRLGLHNASDCSEFEEPYWSSNLHVLVLVEWLS